MALSSRARSPWWLRLHFLIRFLGLTGLLAGGAGLAMALLDLDWSTWRAVVDSIVTPPADPYQRTAIYLVVGGFGAALVALLVDIAVGLRLVAGRRSAFGINVAVQVLLATVLLVGVNVYSYRHYLRLDWTHDHEFTLPADVREQLRQLRGETTIVVYQRHKTFGQLADKPDAYDYAAERKVVEKINDLVEQFRELGPQFRVVELDVEEEGYNDKLAALTRDSPALRKAIDAAPENSIFFLADGKVQRLSFNDFYQLDKTASQEANGGRGNLVLLDQGVEPFARKVLNIDEKRPRVGLAVIHEWLTSEGPEDFGLAGLRKALEARGFEVQDIVLKKWSEFAPPEAAVYTYEESKLSRLEEQLEEIQADIKSLQDEIADLRQLDKLWRTTSLDDLTRRYAKQLGGRRVDEGLRQRQLALIEQNLALRKLIETQYLEDRDATAREKATLNVEAAAEQRRMADLRAKLARLLADCDLLIVPRLTLRNVNIGDRIPNRLYKLDNAQVDAIQDFLKAGKPVLACFGPANEHPDDRMRLAQVDAGDVDRFEEMLQKLGIRLGKQTVLFNVESKSFAERRSGLLVSGANVEVPPVEFDWKPDAVLSPGTPANAPKKERTPNPVRSSMRIAAHSLGKALDLRLRHPRPIYADPEVEKKLPYEPEIMVTSAASWNEDQPFPTRERTPRFEPPKPDDPSRGTLDEERRGPFPIGVALEARLPAEWYEGKDVEPATVRVAAIGHGGLFVGPELSPAREQLLLHTCNWLLGRDDLLPKAEHEWRYPRVSLDARSQALWHWGTWLGLPALFAYLGMVVLLVRRFR